MTDNDIYDNYGFSCQSSASDTTYRMTRSQEQRRVIMTPLPAVALDLHRQERREPSWSHVAAHVRRGLALTRQT